MNAPIPGRPPIDNAAEYARQAQDLVNYGWNHRETAEMLGLTTTWVYRHTHGEEYYAEYLRKKRAASAQARARVARPKAKGWQWEQPCGDLGGFRNCLSQGNCYLRKQGYCEI
ncbi:MAG: hypothetical protein PHX83_11860 [Acidobacteriia bacterium]|nr:hypothetical protein [Terriglobia bacterium]